MKVLTTFKNLTSIVFFIENVNLYLIHTFFLHCIKGSIFQTKTVDESGANILFTLENHNNEI